jgi:cytochrome c1
MKKISIGIAALTLVLAIGCKNQNQTASTNADNNSNNTVATSQTTNMSPEDLGKLGAEIKKHPSDAQKLLSDKGLTEQQFEQAVRKVAESPEQSKRYADAYKKAS